MESLIKDNELVETINGLVRQSGRLHATGLTTRLNDQTDIDAGKVNETTPFNGVSRNDPLAVRWLVSFLNFLRYNLFVSS